MDIITEIISVISSKTYKRFFKSLLTFKFTTDIEELKKIKNSDGFTYSQKIKLKNGRFVLTDKHIITHIILPDIRRINLYIEEKLSLTTLPPTNNVRFLENFPLCLFDYEFIIEIEGLTNEIIELGFIYLTEKNHQKLKELFKK